MPKLRSRVFQFGPYWLGRRAGSDTWFRCWFDEEARQTRRVSLSTSNLEDAKSALTKWFIAQHGKQPQPVSLKQALRSYYHEHGRYVVSQSTLKGAWRWWEEYFGEASAVEACEIDRVAAFKLWLTAKGCSPGYVNRILSVGRAALMREYEKGRIEFRPVVKAIGDVSGEPLGRALSPAELQAMYRYFDAEHLRRFVILGLATGSRPGALFEAKWDQVRLKERLILLNPPHRRQTKKRRPQVPICEELAKHLQKWGDADGWAGHVLHSGGRPLTTINAHWRRARTRLDLGDDCNPYSLRHSAAKWLRSQSVSPWEVAALLGHSMSGRTITEIYATADMQHMVATRNALDRLLAIVAGVR